MVSYHYQLITSHNGISDVFKPPESCRSGWGQTDSQFPILYPLTPLSLYHISQPLPTEAALHFSYSSSSLKEWGSRVSHTPKQTQRDRCRCGDVGLYVKQGPLSSDWLTDWLAGWLAESLSAWLKPLPGHSTAAVLAYEWYCIVRALPIPALLNGFNHWFRFSYTVLVESVPLPPLWTPWFPWLTCLEAAVEMSCCPSHGPDPTFTLIGNKKMTWDGMKPLALCRMCRM